MFGGHHELRNGHFAVLTKIDARSFVGPRFVLGGSAAKGQIDHFAHRLGHFSLKLTLTHLPVVE